MSPGPRSSRQVTISRHMAADRPAPTPESLGRQSWDTWPTYDAAVLGFRDYWYPVAWSKSVSRKPLALTLLGDKAMLLRDEHGQPRALQNRCPHRGVPLSLGRQEVPGTWSCIYHGWTYD